MLVAAVIAVTVLGAEPAKLPLRMTAEVIEQDKAGTWVLARIENTGRATLRIVPPVYRSASGNLWGAGEGLVHGHCYGACVTTVELGPGRAILALALIQHRGAAQGDLTVTFQTATVDADGVCGEDVEVKAKVTRAAQHARDRRVLPTRRIAAETSSLREGQCAYVKRLLRNDTPEVRFYSGPLEANDESPRCHRYGRIGLEPGASVEVWSAEDGTELVHWPMTECLRPER